MAGIVTFFDTASRRSLGSYQLSEQPGGALVQSLRFSPDGKTLAVGGQEPVNQPHGAILDLVDAQSLRRRVRVELPPLPGSEFAVVGSAFIGDGPDLLVAQAAGDFPDGPASMLRRVNGRTGRIEGRPLRVGDHAALDLYPAPHRGRVFMTSALGDATFEIEAESLRVLRRYPAGGLTGVVSPNGRSFALGSVDGSVGLLDLDSGQVRPVAGRHRGPVLRLAFTPDGRTLVSSGGDGAIIARDLADGDVRETLSAHRGDVWRLQIAPDGRTLYSGANDGRTMLWDLRGDRRLLRSFGIGRPVGDTPTPRGLAVSPDGRTLAFTHRDGSVDLVDTGTLQRRRSWRAMREPAAAVAFSPDGDLLAAGGEGGRITLWDARTLAEAGELGGLDASVQAIAFSPDGQLLAAAEVDTPRPRLQVWDVRRRSVVITADTGATSLAFSPDGNLLAVAALDRGTEIYEARTARLVERLPTGGLSRSVAFSHEGGALAVGQFDGDIRLYRPTAGSRCAAR